MQSFAHAPRPGARRLCWLASTAFTSVMLPLCSLPAAAQQSASPDLELREVEVNPPPGAPRRPAARPSTPSTSSAPRTASAPTAANDPVVVSPTSIATPSENVASSVTVITSQQIEQQQLRSAAEALKTVPGLNIVQTGGPGGQTSIFLRGTNSNHTKFLIDGIDVSDPSNPNRSFDLGQLLTGDIERIEVLRGPQSGLYGSDALGGVVSVITKKGEGPPKITFSTEGGTFGTFNQYGSLSGGAENYNYAFNIDHYHAGSVPVTPLDLLAKVGRVRINDYYDNWTGSTKLGANLSENFTVNFVARYTEATLRFTGDDFSIFPAGPAKVQSTQLVNKFFSRSEGVYSAFDGRFTNYFGVNFTDHWNWNRTTPTSVPSINTGDRIRYDYRGVVTALPNTTVLFGASDETETFQQGTLNKSAETKGVFIEAQTQYANRFFMVANGRFDDDQYFGGHTTYRLAPAVIVPWTETKLKATYGTAFKAPSLSQKFLDFPPTFFANPNLLPEESVGYDYGFEQPLWNDQARFGVTWFSNDITNLIGTARTGVIDFTFGFPIPVIQNVNIGHAFTKGLEAFAAVNVTDRIKLRGDYTFTRAVDATTGLELLRRPRHKGSLTALFNPIDPLTISATVLHVGDWIDGSRPDFNRITQPGYTVVNLAANYQVNQYVQAFGRVDNLFDEKYQNPSGFDRPGLAVYAGMKLTNR
jgi:vitamin B12 transporter